MKWFVILFGVLGFAAPPAMANSARTAEEFHIISRDKMNRFRGSHQLLRRPQVGFVQVMYCDTVYWVRPRTVAWSEQEADLGYALAIETNLGTGWSPVCMNPQQQVTLKDLDLAPKDEKAAAKEPVQRKFRFQEIRKSFEAR
ncbi:hypothetical protein [Pannonibacter sp. SL95]|uniref:hypothetical protein n=1 Tax=Pannonibacter sp. SL95 TaxID=2995153 RepID=UPI002272C5D5|nr:hypothetical protein [Pannonibacter sp. SL95]MCY1707382.1 hypothetical protein [Pannonibacter sp. SL95]